MFLAFERAAVEITRLSKEGKIIIPKALRTAHKWETGQEFMVIDTADGVLLKPKKLFPETKLEDVAGCLAYSGKPKTIEEMNAAIEQGFQEQWHDRSRH